MTPTNHGRDEMKRFIASYRGKTVEVAQISASKAIATAAKIFGVKLTKVSVQEVKWR
jgi:hypothetical protein